MPSPTLILAITTAIQSIVALATVAVPVLAPAAAADLGVSVGKVGYFISNMYVGASISARV